MRRNGKRMAGDSRTQSDTSRTIAQQEGLSETCLERFEQAERFSPPRRRPPPRLQDAHIV
jgi:hypothetical protein